MCFLNSCFLLINKVTDCSFIHINLKLSVYMLCFLLNSFGPAPSHSLDLLRSEYFYNSDIWSHHSVLWKTCWLFLSSCCIALNPLHRTRTPPYNPHYLHPYQVRAMLGFYILFSYHLFLVYKWSPRLNQKFFPDRLWAHIQPSPPHRDACMAGPDHCLI